MSNYRHTPIDSKTRRHADSAQAAFAKQKERFGKQLGRLTAIVQGAEMDIEKHPEDWTHVAQLSTCCSIIEDCLRSYENFAI